MSNDNFSVFVAVLSPEFRPTGGNVSLKTICSRNNDILQCSSFEVTSSDEAVPC